jgi:YVTN family beta-propeller protein
MQRLRPLAGLLAAGLAGPAIAAPSVPFPDYHVGKQADGTFVVSTGQIISPAGTDILLGIRIRAKAVAVNPNVATHTAAVLTMGGGQGDNNGAVEIIDTLSGKVVQRYSPSQDFSGSYSGVTYSSDGKYLLFSQDSSYVSLAEVNANGILGKAARVSVPPDNTLIQCFPNSPLGDYGRPCGTFYTTGTSYPGGVAFSADNKTAYALLNQNNTLVSIDLTQNPPAVTNTVRTGNAPHSVVLSGDFAYVSNEGGRVAQESDFQIYSAGTPIVADYVTGAAITGTVSVVDLKKQQVVTSIDTGGLHPTDMALFGPYVLVSNTYSDTISVIDTRTRKVARTINLGLPISVPGTFDSVYGAAPTGIAVNQSAGIAYVALYNANAIAVVDLSGGNEKPVLGLIPVAFAPASVALDSAHNQLIVANDKGVGTLYSTETDHGVTGKNTHQDNGTVSIVPIPSKTQLSVYTQTVYQNNHWDLQVNIAGAGNPNPAAAPVAIPAHIGEPSLIKHVFVIIRENRTYDQILGDVAKGNGDPKLAVFGGADTPNAHLLVQTYPLFDNFYDPSRQSADGHQWIVEGMAPYADDIQSPDWVRSYPGGNAGDALAYQNKGFLFNEAVQAGLSLKIYGEYVENEFWPTSLGHPTWLQLYADALAYESGNENTLTYQNAIQSESSIPVVANHLITNFPQFDLNIPDQFRVDIWAQDFNKDLANNTVPALSFLWVMDDHTGGPPTPDAEQADNDLAIGRIIDIISHSAVWSSSAIFIEEDDAQNGVDHVDGHRSPAYIISPYAVQTGSVDHTYYSQVNMTRTIEQILGLPPMNQYDLVASPMRTAFTDTPNFTPFTHVPNQIPLDQGVAGAGAVKQGALEKGWRDLKVRMFAGKATKPDSVDPDTLSHFDWYEATGYKRPFPGEQTVRPAADFASQALKTLADDLGD